MEFGGVEGRVQSDGRDDGDVIYVELQHTFGMAHEYCTVQLQGTAVLYLQYL